MIVGGILPIKCKRIRSPEEAADYDAGRWCKAATSSRASSWGSSRGIRVAGDLRDSSCGPMASVGSVRVRFSSRHPVFSEEHPTRLVDIFPRALCRQDFWANEIWCRLAGSRQKSMPWIPPYATGGSERLGRGICLYPVVYFSRHRAGLKSRKPHPCSRNEAVSKASSSDILNCQAAPLAPLRSQIYSEE